jgi:PiT family inorganic phosphate transporter
VNITKKGLDKDLKRLGRIEAATLAARRPRVSLALGLLFLALVWALASFQAGTAEHSFYIVVGGVIGGYMALNIGANDVANNVGPAVGSRALTMMGALVIAAIFEAAGAILAGGEVVSTISKSIVDPAFFSDTRIFIWAMTAALVAAALWINLATYVGAPVSTTHSIVGGVLGAGLAAAGTAAVNWPTLGAIVASWVISPVLGGVIAAGFFALVEFAVLRRTDRRAAAVRWVPVLVAIMAGTFALYLMTKGVKNIWRPSSATIAILTSLVTATAFFLVRPLVSRTAETMENRRKAVSDLFTVPLICSAALLSFAHGANDVANAVGPLAAIVSAAGSGAIATKVGIPWWVMFVGAIGISAGLVLFGPKLIQTVGSKITKLDRSRAFCVALSAAVTVIAASALGLPVSSTHIAVGGVFGVGFFRELHANHRRRRATADMFVDSVDNADFLRSQIASESAAPARVADDTTTIPAGSAQETPEQKALRKKAKAERRRLVRRQHFTTIVAAWLITVPFSATLAAATYYILSIML